MNIRILFLFAANLFLLHAARAAEAWKPLEPAMTATFMTVDHSGTIYVIDTGSQVYFLEKDSTAWKPLLKTKKIKYISVSPDGTITALDRTEPYGYTRPYGGKWETKPMNLKAYLYTNSGSAVMLSADGIAYFDGNRLTGVYTTICATQKADGIYLLGLDQALYRYSKGDISPQTVKGGGGVSAMAGSGYGTKGGHYILDNTPEHQLLAYDPSYAYGWVKQVTPVPFVSIAMAPDGRLFGISADHRVYVFGAGR